PDGAREIVLDDAEVVAVVADVRRQEERVSSPLDDLSAERGRAPIHIERELVGLHDLRWLGEALADLREEGEVSAGSRVVIAQAGIGELLRATDGCPLDEGARGG